MVRKLILATLLVAVVGAGAVIVLRATVASCSPDHLPARIGVFQQTNRTVTSAAQLPPRSGSPQGRPAVVVDLPGFDICPLYSADDADLPMDVWLRLSANLYVEYGRTGGGP